MLHFETSLYSLLYICIFQFSQFLMDKPVLQKKKHRRCFAIRSASVMWMKNMHSFLGLKIVPEIIAEMNEKGQTLSMLCKDAEEEEVICPKLQHLDLGAPPAPSQASAVKPFRRLRGYVSRYEVIWYSFMYIVEELFCY